MKRRALLSLLLITIISVFIPKFIVQAQNPIVRAVLFYSPDCSLCHEVMEKTLAPLVNQFPGQLDIVGIDVSHPLGKRLFRDTIAALRIPEDRLGVPTLVVGDHVLVGADEIPTYLPDIIQVGLADGGLDWPEIPGLESVLTAQNGAAQAPRSNLSSGQDQPTFGGTPGFIQNFMKDPLANTIAVIVLLGMVACSLWVIISYLKGPESEFLRTPEWLLPLLAILGLFVAFYLSYIEITKTEAFCGPVGNCNSVQESPYAHLFGVIPIGALGLVGYATILGFWLFKTFGPAKLRNFNSLVIWGLAWFGVIFSIYLTFLEPFVIGATCAWCVTSAILMTLILLVSTQPAKEAMQLTGGLEDDDFSNFSQEEEIA